MTHAHVLVMVLGLAACDGATTEREPLVVAPVQRAAIPVIQIRAPVVEERAVEDVERDDEEAIAVDLGDAIVDDEDDDHLAGAIDQCPDDPEDLDGHDDDDGCPDADHDIDMVLDVEDRCPEEPSDTDFADYDGCPEFPAT